jgi:hypothetical protein
MQKSERLSTLISKLKARFLLVRANYVEKYRNGIIKVLIIIGLPLICALIYDQWRYSAEQQSHTRKEFTLPTNRKENDFLLFAPNDFIAPVSLLTKLKLGQGPLEKYIRSRQDSEVHSLLDNYTPPDFPNQKLLQALVRVFDGLLFDPSLYESSRFAGVALSKDTEAALRTQASDDKSHMSLNRMLLEDAYPREILNSREEINSQIEGTVTTTQLLDEFTKQTEKAKAEYLGKRFLIRGLIGEVVKVPKRGFNPFVDESPKYEVMLVSNDYLPRTKMRLPFRRDVGARYSNIDVDADIQFKGVYCYFLYPFRPRAFGDDLLSGEKRELMVSCEIVGFEKGVTRAPEPEYRSRLDPEDLVDKYVGQEKERIIAVKCIEREYGLEEFR